METNYTVGDVVKRGNPVVFFDITISGHAAGRIKIELFKNIVPKVSGVSASNRKQWCSR